MRLLFMLSALLLAVFTGSARAASFTATEHARVVEYTAFLESHPFDDRAPAMRSWLLSWENKSTDTVDVVCEKVLAPLPSKDVAYSGELLAQFIFGSAANQLINPASKGQFALNQLAGMRSLLRAYASILQSKPDAHNPRLDELSRQEAAGTLESFLTPVVQTCKSA